MRQLTPPPHTGPSTVITPAATTQHESTRISSTSSITSTLDGTVESRILSLESTTEQTNRMMQDMMKMMERFTSERMLTYWLKYALEVVSERHQRLSSLWSAL